jgi:mono/diheme cytochrome c family protein
VKGSRRVLLGLISCAGFVIAGCSSHAQNNDGADAALRMHGKAVYDVQCAMCHDATNLHLIKEPPRLEGMFHKSALPSGAPATDAEVRDVILHGKGIMPPFEQSVNSDDVNAVIAYLHSR